jgi:hypothetical protein
MARKLWKFKADTALIRPGLAPLLVFSRFVSSSFGTGAQSIGSMNLAFRFGSVARRI